MRFDSTSPTRASSCHPEAARSRRGLGLIGVRERLSLVDGECATESKPGAGTRIRARVPLPGATEEKTTRSSSSA